MEGESNNISDSRLMKGVMDEHNGQCTKGWHKFVKAKSLRATNTIVFNLCESKNGTNENRNTFVIDVMKNVEDLPMDLELNHDAIDVDAALTPGLLFRKQIELRNKPRVTLDSFSPFRRLKMVNTRFNGVRSVAPVNALAEKSAARGSSRGKGR
uniref:Uncharacterized protein n=1 Tax=Solanum tuberosum TaxID=4113 RepID=M1BAM0_SOLTU